MKYYSIAAYSTISLQHQSPPIFIESGINAFTVLTDDIDGLVMQLEASGIKILSVNTLDDWNDK